MSTWQPVSTAPRIQWLLVCEHGFIYIGMFTEDGLCELQNESYIKPSHWMPLPDPQPHITHERYT